MEVREVGVARDRRQGSAVHHANVEAMEVVDPEPATIKRFTRAEYEELVERGVFADQHVELLRGLVCKVSPQGVPHRRMVVWLTRRLIELLDVTWNVRPALPYAATDDSEPEPDLMITREPETREGPRSAPLLIEIADSSLRLDRRVKRSIYAEAGAPEYWIVNVSKPGEVTVEIYTEPSGSEYGRLVTMREGDVLRPAHVPFELAVAELPR